MTYTLLVTNGTPIPLEGEYKVHFWVAGIELTICAVLTKSVHEFILGVDFLSENSCRWDFWTDHVLLGDLWVRLHQHAPEQEHRYVFNGGRCIVEVLVDVSRPTWRTTEYDLWVTDSLEIADGVVAPRTLFGAKDFRTIVRVLNLTDRPYKLKPD